MKSSFVVAALFLILVSSPYVLDDITVRSQSSEEYRLEEATILQDNPVVPKGVVPVQTDGGRNSRLSKEGFSALIGDNALRVSLENTKIDLKDDPNGVGVSGKAAVKIMYTDKEGYALYLGRKSSSHSSNSVNATGCDMGAARCFVTHARPWTQPQSYGYGYSLRGNGVLPDFVSDTYFRPFSTVTSLDPMGIFVAGGQGKGQSVSLNVRLNSRGREPASFTDTIVLTVLHDW